MDWLKVRAVEAERILREIPEHLRSPSAQRLLTAIDGTLNNVIKVDFRKNERNL